MEKSAIQKGAEIEDLLYQAKRSQTLSPENKANVIRILEESHASLHDEIKNELREIWGNIGEKLCHE